MGVDEETRDEADFPSGPWAGFWLQPERYRQDLNLTFRQGKLTGTGNDCIGTFLIRGRYDAETKEVWWTKTYPGRHDVAYRGFRELNSIWGTWSIGGVIAQRGGFRIWPRGQGVGEAVSTEAEEPLVTTTSPAPAQKPPSTSARPGVVATFCFGPPAPSSRMSTCM